MTEQARSECKTKNALPLCLPLQTPPDRFGYEHFGECSKRDNNRYIEANFCVATSSSEAIPMRTFLLRYSVAVQIAAGQVHETVHTLSIGKRQTKMTLACAFLG